MSSRTYGQVCPLAQALDRVGDRWTPLIIRDLAAGPRRYSDLVSGLPGIGTTLLAERLRRLVEDGLVTKRELPPPAASTVYELTSDGRQIMAAFVPLATWGLRYLADLRDDDVRPEWVLMFMQNNFDASRAAGVHEVYEFRVGTHVFHVAVAGGTISTSTGPAPRPADAVIKADWQTFVDLGLGRVDPRALSPRKLSFEGDPETLVRCYELLVGGLPEESGDVSARHATRPKARSRIRP